MPVTLVLFHQNLRVADNRALSWAAARGEIIPLYIYEDNLHPIGGASKWWLRESLIDLAANLKALGAPMVLRRGDPLSILKDIIKASGADAVTWNRRFEPDCMKQDHALHTALHDAKIEVKIHEGFLLFDPASIRTGGGTPFKVYTPFSKACLSAPPPSKPIPAPKKLTGVAHIASDDLDTWKLVPRTAVWPKGLAEAWDVGEKAAHRTLREFIKDRLSYYKGDRDIPSVEGTSRMSPYLHYGQISPQQVWEVIQQVQGNTAINSASVERYLLEILWREFSWHLLHQFPQLPSKPFNASFTDFAWANNKAAVAAWQKGLTGYPIVDAGMRQLWQTGWMHNRVRMIVASFLIKDLLIDWREGEAWFWDTLVDADLGSNAASWQWVAGCGADAAPFFRIFNPMLQGKKFDPKGDYVRAFVPELAKLDDKWIHEPWRATEDELARAKITIGKTYPAPIIDHDKARQRALAVLKARSH